jgi:hypothetical protein
MIDSDARFVSVVSLLSFVTPSYGAVCSLNAKVLGFSRSSNAGKTNFKLEKTYLNFSRAR